MADSERMRILIVLAPLGGGHYTVARALSEACQQLGGSQVEVGILNVFSKACSRFPLTAIPKLYQFFTTDMPILWHMLYRATNSSFGFALAERLAQPFLQRGLRRILLNWQPDIVVLVFPALGRSISWALNAIGSTVPIITVVIDLVTVHVAWLCDASTAYVVATQEAAEACRNAKIPQEHIHCYGLPIPCEPMQLCLDRTEIRHRLGLDIHIPTVLIMGGAGGVGDIEALVGIFSKMCPSTQLVVITGNNETLRRRLIGRPHSLPCIILGYVDNVGDWMRASDLLITKPGPATVTEAIYADVPMILTEGLPQELGTVSYLVKHHAAFAATNINDVAKLATELLHNPSQMRVLRQNGEGLLRRNAACDTATLILAMVENKSLAARGRKDGS